MKMRETDTISWESAKNWIWNFATYKERNGEHALNF